AFRVGAFGATATCGCDCPAPAASPSNRYSSPSKAKPAILPTSPTPPNSVGKTFSDFLRGQALWSRRFRLPSRLLGDRSQLNLIIAPPTSQTAETRAQLLTIRHLPTARGAGFDMLLPMNSTDSR